MSFTGGGTNLGSAYGAVKIGSDLKGIDAASKSLTTFQKSAEASAKKISAQFQAIGNAAKKAGQVLSVSVTAPLVLAGKKAISAASDLNEALSATDVIFGDASDSVKAFAEGADKNLGLSEEAALSAAVQFAALAKQADLTGDAAAGFSDQLLQNSADLASFFNTDPSQALDALRSGLIGESEPLRRYNILISEAQVQQKGLELGLTDVNGQMSEGAKVVARYALIQDQMGAAQGDFARTSGGLANSLRTLQGEATNVGAIFGQVMLPVVLNIVQKLIALAEEIKSLSPDMQRFVAIVAAVAAAAGPALIIFGQMLNIFSKVGAAAALITGPLGLVVAALAILALAWKNDWGGIQELVAGVVGQVINTIGRMVQFFQHAKERGLDPFSLAFRTLIVVLGEKAPGSPIVDFLQEIYRFLNKVGDAIKTGDFDAFFQTLDRAGARLGTWVKEQASKALGFGAQLLQNIIKSFDGLNWNTVRDTFGDAIKGAVELRHDFYATIITFGATLLSNILKSFDGVNWTTVGDAIVNGLGDLGGLLSDAAGFIKDLAGGEITFGAQMLQVINDSFDGVNWDLIGSTIQTGFHSALDHLSTWGAEMAQKALDSLKGVNWDAIKDEVAKGLSDFKTKVFDPVIGGLVTFGAGVLQGLVDSFKGVNWDLVWNTITTGLGELKDWTLTVGLPTAWTLATGFKDKLRDELTRSAITVENFTGWSLGLGLPGGGGGAAFSAGVPGNAPGGGTTSGIDFGTWFHDRLVEQAITVEKFTTWQLTMGTPEKLDIDVAGIVDAITNRLSTQLQSPGQGFVSAAGKLGAQLGKALADEIVVSIKATFSGGGGKRDLMAEVVTGAGLGDQTFSFGDAFAAFDTAFSNALKDGITKAIKDAIDGINWFPEIKKAIAKGAEIIDGVRHGAQDLFNNQVGPFFKSLPGNILQALEDASKALAQNFNALGASVIDAIKQGVIQPLADLKTFIQKALDDIANIQVTLPGASADPNDPNNPMLIPSGSNVEGQSNDFRKAGQDAAAGYAQGIQDGQPDAEQAGRDLAAKAVGGTQTQQESASPSRVFQGLGQFAGQGYIAGIQSVTSAAETAGRQLAQAADTGASSVLDNIKTGIGSLVGGIVDSFNAISGAAKTSTSDAAQAQQASDAERVASAQDTTDKMTGEEAARAAIAGGVNDQTAADTKAANDKRLQAEHDYARASIENERTRVDAIKSANSDLTKTLHDEQVKRLQSEHALAQALQGIDADRVAAEKDAESQLADLADQRAQAEEQAAKQKADIESQLQQQLSDAEKQFNSTQSDNLQQQQDARTELASQLKDAAAAWKDANQQAVDSIKQIREELKKTLEQGREEFDTFLRDNTTSTDRLNEDFQRSLDALNVQRSRVNEDLSAKLVDPSLSEAQRAQARIDAARQLQDIDTQQQDLEIQHQRDIADAEQAKSDAEQKHIEDEKAARDAAHNSVMQQKQAEQDAEKAYHDQRMKLEDDAAKKIADLQSQLATAASDFHDQQAKLRDDATSQIADLADQEASTMSDLAKREQDIYDQRAAAFADLEKRKTDAFRQAEQDRTTIARDEQNARDAAAKAQDQAERQAAQDQRKALRQLNATEDATDKGIATQHGTDLGTAQGDGVVQGLTDSQPKVQDAGGQLAASANTGAASQLDGIKTTGVDWAQSFIDGVLSRLGGATSAGNQLSTAAEDGLRTAADLHSPSKKFFNLGAITGQSYASGILSQQQAASAAMAALTGAQSITRSGIASQVTADRQRAAIAAQTIPGSIAATVVIEDKQLRQYVLGTAIAPMLTSRDRASGSLF